jgi:carbonic anhydrase
MLVSPEPHFYDSKRIFPSRGTVLFMLAHQAFAPSFPAQPEADATDASKPPRPLTADDAVATLMAGHQQFRKWVSRLHNPSGEPEAEALRSTAMVRELFPEDHVPVQEPFAIAVGCADSRVPLRMLFGSVVNDLFEVRVAGQVLADECVGSIEYALHHLPSVKTIVVLGHSDCGAVRAAVDNYLDPCCPKTEEMSIGFRSIVNHMLGAILQSDRSLQIVAAETNTPLSPEQYQACLLEAVVAINAATIAHRIAYLTAKQGRDDLKVVYGVYDLLSHGIVHPSNEPQDPSWQLGLVEAPATSADVTTTALAACRAAIASPARTSDQPSNHHAGCC